MAVICPKCNQENGDDFRFCEFCGQSLETKPQQEQSVRSTLCDLAELISPETSANKPSAAPHPAVELDVPGDEQIILQVEYRENLFFPAGAQVPLELRITPLVPGFRNLRLWFEPITVSNEKQLMEIPVDSDLVRGKSFDLQIPYRPPADFSGLQSFRFYFGCILNKGTHYYQMTTRHRVYAEQDRIKQKSMVNQITFNASEAGSINAGLQELFSHPDQPDQFQRQLELLDQLPQVMELQRLSRTSWRPEQRITEGNPWTCSSMTLNIGGKLFQLLAQETVSLGRSAEDNDLVVADPLLSTSPLEYPNSTVSRCHAKIHNRGDSIDFFDLSRHGCFINGKRIPADGCRLPDQALVEFGDIHWQLQLQKCLCRPDKPFCRSCPAMAIRSLLFVRTDNVPEGYCLVWECCDLTPFSADLAGWKVYRRNDSFVLQFPDETLHYLYPGFQAEWEGRRVSGESFRQFSGTNG